MSVLGSQVFGQASMESCGRWRSINKSINPQFLHGGRGGIWPWPSHQRPSSSRVHTGQVEMEKSSLSELICHHIVRESYVFFFSTKLEFLCMHKLIFLLRLNQSVHPLVFFTHQIFSQTSSYPISRFQLFPNHSALYSRLLWNLDSRLCLTIYSRP